VARTKSPAIRCHKIDGKGGEVGPDLTGSASGRTGATSSNRSSPPTGRSPKGFETLILATRDGQVQSGILKQDDGNSLRLITPEGKQP